MSLGGHLKELRRRLFLSATSLRGQHCGLDALRTNFAALSAPVIDYAKLHHAEASVNLPTITAAFDLQMQVSIFVGIIISSPLWLFQIGLSWRRLFRNAKSDTRSGFYCLRFLCFLPVWLWLGEVPAFISTLLSFTPAGSVNLISAQEYVLFVVRVLLVFGLAFVLPVVLVMLNLAEF
jgi:sec-independent protein translocase protein TatC